jgi:hypothetical protein
VRALPHVAGFPDLRVLRPAPTAARPPTPLPGFAGYRPGIAPATPQATGPRRLSWVPTTTVRTFNAQYAGGFLSARSWTKSAFRGLRRERTGSAPSISRVNAGRLTTLTQASLALQTARSLRPASHPASRPRTEASLPGTQTSPWTGLTPAGHRELVAPTSFGPPCPHGAGAVPAHSSRAAAASRLFEADRSSRMPIVVRRASTAHGSWGRARSPAHVDEGCGGAGDAVGPS